MKIPIEWNGGEDEVEITASSDRVVVSCDLLEIKTAEGVLVVVIDAEFRKSPLGQAFQHLWDVVNEEQKESN